MTRRKKRQTKIDQQREAERRALKRQKACGSKVQYNSDLEALAWGRTSNERRNENKEWDTYFCEFCHKWHLTNGGK